MEVCKQQSEIEMRHLPVISICGYVGGRQIACKYFCYFEINVSFVYGKTCEGLAFLDYESMILVGINGTKIIHKHSDLVNRRTFLSFDTAVLYLTKSRVCLVLIQTRQCVRPFLAKTAISGFEEAHVSGGIGTLPAGGAA